MEMFLLEFTWCTIFFGRNIWIFVLAFFYLVPYLSAQRNQPIEYQFLQNTCLASHNYGHGGFDTIIVSPITSCVRLKSLQFCNYLRQNILYLAIYRMLATNLIGAVLLREKSFPLSLLWSGIRVSVNLTSNNRHSMDNMPLIVRSYGWNQTKRSS